MTDELKRAHITALDRASIREYTTARAFGSTFLPGPSITAVVWSSRARLGLCFHVFLCHPHPLL